jgi:hypothetical protein
MAAISQNDAVELMISCLVFLIILSWWLFRRVILYTRALEEFNKRQDKVGEKDSSCG